MLGWMCPEGTQCRQGSPDAPDATRCGVLVQDAQDAQDAGSRLRESGPNTSGSDAGHLFADEYQCQEPSLHYDVVDMIDYPKAGMHAPVLGQMYWLGTKVHEDKSENVEL